MKKKRISLFFPFFLGTFAFFIVVGIRVLDPSNIAWLSTKDKATYYLGWLFYRNSSWNLPLGLNPTYGLELSNSIVYSDSNPLFAIFFKLFSNLLPATFQYFGIWLFICFILQAYFGWKLVGLATGNHVLRFLGAGLFVFSPPMIYRLGERVGAHINLVGHFFILASLYFAFKENYKKRIFIWTFLAVLVSLVHAYLLAMVLAIWIFDLIGRVIKRQINKRNSLIEFVVLLSLVIFSCWLAGYFCIERGYHSGGFGFFRMNFLSLVNSNGWSYLLKEIPQRKGDYEGFNYLGSGLLFLFILSFLKLIFGKNQLDKYKCLEFIKKYGHLVILFLVLTLFAISNKFAIGTFEYEYVSLPKLIFELCSLFRASGRFFWPVFYVITFLLILLIIKNFNKRIAILILSVSFFIQIVDTSAGWIPIRKKHMIKKSSNWNSSFIHPFWIKASKKYKKFRYIPIKNRAPMWQEIAYYAGKNGLSTDAIYLARVNLISLKNARKKAFDTIESRCFEKDSLYILDDSLFRKLLYSNKLGKDDFISKIDGFNVVAPNWNNGM